MSSAIGGGGSGGIGGTGALISTGTIDGTGSIFVNGIRFEVEDAEITIDGAAAVESELRPGMVGTVRGNLNEDGVSAIAEQVTVRQGLRGPVTAIELDADANSLRLEVLGQTVIAERTATVYAGTTFLTLSTGDLVTVSGFRDELNRLRATRIEVNAPFEPGLTEVRAEGSISQLAGFSFVLGNIPVDASSAMINLNGDELSNGQAVVVRGTLNAAGDTLLATRIDPAPSAEEQLQTNAEARVQGSISDFQNAGQFRVNGVAVDARSATRTPGDLQLGNRLVVEVDGTWNGSTLVAAEIRSRRGRIQLEAMVQAIDAGERSLTLGFFTGEVTVVTDSRTLFKDDEDDDRFITLADLRTGDAVEVEAIQEGDRLLATRVARDDELDEEVVRGPVQSFVAGASITILGLQYETAGAEFEGEDDRDLDAASFFASLTIGDLVEVTDTTPADGIAEKVESASAVALAGDEFDDDGDLND
ncbi:DUF5666 domain-containing protein, partial [Lamprobacter sp.]|uniref:DUF5666 domain-containing protein n=1 Tax=Lamprobacter sp. TaxID=3100796 RepID=UPI002B25D59A